MMLSSLGKAALIAGVNDVSGLSPAMFDWPDRMKSRTLASCASAKWMQMRTNRPEAAIFMVGLSWLGVIDEPFNPGWCLTEPAGLADGADRQTVPQLALCATPANRLGPRQCHRTPRAALAKSPQSPRSLPESRQARSPPPECQRVAVPCCRPGEN